MMAAKLEKEIAEVLKGNAVTLRVLLQEVQLLRKDIAKHSAEQQCALKDWMAKDLDTTSRTIEMIKEKAREKEKFSYPATISQEKIEET